MSGSLPEHAAFIHHALQLAPGEKEYQFFAGLAAYQSGDYEEALRWVENLALPAVLGKHEPARIYILQKSYEMLGETKKAADCGVALKQLLEAHNATDFFANSIKPLIDRS